MGFIALGVLVGILLYYLIQISRTFLRIIERAERDINDIGDATKEVLEDIRASSLFQFLSKFSQKKKRSKKIKRASS